MSQQRKPIATARIESAALRRLGAGERSLQLGQQLGQVPRLDHQLVLRGAFNRVMIGLVLGLPLAVGAGKLISAQLYGVSSWDPFALSVATIAAFEDALP